MADRKGRRPPMVEVVSAYIREQGIAPANFYYEKFAASA